MAKASSIDDRSSVVYAKLVVCNCCNKAQSNYLNY